MKRRVREEDEVGELNIVPYLDIVVNLLMFMLLSMAGLIQLGVLDVGTPKVGEPDSVQAATNPADKPKEEFTLTVAITDKGFTIAGAGGVLPGSKPVSDGSVDTTGEPTVPLRSGKYDYGALTAKMAEIKSAFPAENRVILVAEMDIPYEVIVGTMDACRERLVRKGELIERAVLFAEVWLSMMR